MTLQAFLSFSRLPFLSQVQSSGMDEMVLEDWLGVLSMALLSSATAIELCYPLSYAVLLDHTSCDSRGLMCL